MAFLAATISQSPDCSASLPFCFTQWGITLRPVQCSSSPCVPRWQPGSRCLAIAPRVHFLQARPAAVRRAAMLPNKSFERPQVEGGPRLAAAVASWPAAQLHR